MSARACVLCGGLQHRAIFHEFGIDILQCRECRHIFSSFAADPHYAGFWGDTVAEDPHFYWNQGRSRMHQEFLRRYVAPGSGRLLDMGSGLGFFLKAVAVHPGWEAHGCEISSAAVRHARERLGLQNVFQSRLEDADFPQSYFDIITMWDLIDHVLYPDPVLKRCHALLKEGGICFLRTPNVFNQLLRARFQKLMHGMQPDRTYLMARDHLHHYSPITVRRLLERNGFSCIEFLHLRPIQSVAGIRGAILGGVKNLCFEAVRALAMVSGGQWNLDNLFVLARKNLAHRVHLGLN